MTMHSRLQGWTVDRGAGHYAAERVRHKRPSLVQIGRCVAEEGWLRCMHSEEDACGPLSEGQLYRNNNHKLGQLCPLTLSCSRHAGRSRVKVTGISWRVMVSHMLKRGEGDHMGAIMRRVCVW
jgi:hypothetical protein